jgi:hypothetical protein
MKYFQCYVVMTHVITGSFFVFVGELCIRILVIADMPLGLRVTI